MSITAAQLHALLPELRLPKGGVVRKAWSHNEKGFLLEIREPGRNKYVLVSLTPGATRVCLVPEKLPQPERPPGFVMLLRKWLHGARVLDMEQPSGDRTLAIRFSVRRSEDPNDIVALSLYTELTPNGANAFLVDHEDKILGLWAPVETPHRTLKTGDVYTLPELPPDFEKSRAWADPLHLSELEADGARSVSLREHYKVYLEDRAAQEVSRTLLQRLKKRQKTLKRRLKAVEKDLQRAEEASAWKKYGELLQSAYGKIPRGASSASVPDYYQDGMPTLEIPLDPGMSLQENIDRYFKKYRKYNNAEDVILERLEETETRLEEVTGALQKTEPVAWVATGGRQGKTHGSSLFMERTEATQTLRAWMQQWEESGLLPAVVLQRVHQAIRQERAALPYREFTDLRGRTILVGKGGKHNDTLSLKIARGRDLWLHAQGWAGAHVILRLNKGENIDQERLLDAATLAAWYSKGKNDTLVEVYYTYAKHVRKPKGYPPGRVSISGGKAIAVKIEDKRLARLMERD